MIILTLRGRLGNQLFIYAFGRYLQEKTGLDIVFFDNINDTGGNSLIHYNIPKSVKIFSAGAGSEFDYKNMKASDYNKLNKSIISGLRKNREIEKFYAENNIPIMNLKQKLLFYFYKVMIRLKPSDKRYDIEKKYRNLFIRNGLFFCENGYIKVPKLKTKDLFCYGYFQSEKYFKHIKDIIRKELTPIHEVKEENKEFIQQIKNTESVCVSIRLGDTVNNPVLGVCTVNYFQRAIDKMSQLHEDAVFFIFSDEIERVKSTFRFKGPVIFEHGDNPDYEKLRYMSMCKHFILSNSSFSWWVQYLSDHPGKTVIAPERWLADETPCDIYQDHWILESTK